MDEDKSDDLLEIKRLAKEALRGESPEEMRATIRKLRHSQQLHAVRFLAFADVQVTQLRALSRQLVVSADILYASQLPSHKSQAAIVRTTVTAATLQRRDQLEKILVSLPPRDSEEKTIQWVAHVISLEANLETFTQAVRLCVDRLALLHTCAQQVIVLLSDTEGEDATICLRELVRLI